MQARLSGSATRWPTNSCRRRRRNRPSAAKKGRAIEPDEELRKFLVRIDSEVRPLRLNFYKRAKLANSFKWKLLQNGVEPGVVDELTRMLLVRLAGK